MMVIGVFIRSESKGTALYRGWETKKKSKEKEINNWKMTEFHLIIFQLRVIPRYLPNIKIQFLLDDPVGDDR